MVITPVQANGTACGTAMAAALGGRLAEGTSFGGEPCVWRGTAQVRFAALAGGTALVVGGVAAAAAGIAIASDRRKRASVLV